MRSVTLYRPGEATPEGDPLEVNPAMVGAIEAHPRSEGKCVLNIFGQKYTVRGSREAIAAALGWVAEAKSVQTPPPPPAEKPRLAASDDEL